MLDELSFVNSVNQFMGIELAVTQLDEPLVHLKGWDSLMGLRLLNQLEKQVGFKMSFAKYVQATTLRDIYAITQPGRSA